MTTTLPPGPYRWLGDALVLDKGRRPVVLTASRDRSGTPFLATCGDDGRMRRLSPDEPLARAIAALPELVAALHLVLGEHELHGRVVESIDDVKAALEKAGLR